MKIETKTVPIVREYVITLSEEEMHDLAAVLVQRAFDHHPGGGLGTVTEAVAKLFCQDGLWGGPLRDLRRRAESISRPI